MPVVAFTSTQARRPGDRLRLLEKRGHPGGNVCHGLAGQTRFAEPALSHVAAIAHGQRLELDAAFLAQAVSLQLDATVPGHVECRQGGPPVRRLPQRAPQEVGGCRAESGPEGLRDEVQGGRPGASPSTVSRLVRRLAAGASLGDGPAVVVLGGSPGGAVGCWAASMLHRSRGRLGLDRAGRPSVVRDVGGRPPRALLWLALGPAGVKRLQGLRAGFPELDIRRSPVGDLFQAPARELVTDLAERGRAACPDGVVRLRLELLPQCSDRLAPAHGPQCADRTPPLGEGKLRAAEHPCEVRRCRGVLGREHRGHRHLAQVCVAVVEQRVEQLRPGRQLVPGHVHRREVAHVPVTVGDGGEVDRDPLLTGERPGVLEQRPRDVRGRPWRCASRSTSGSGASASSRRVIGSPASCGDAAMQSRGAGAAALGRKPSTAVAAGSGIGPASAVAQTESSDGWPSPSRMISCAATLARAVPLGFEELGQRLSDLLQADGSRHRCQHGSHGEGDLDALGQHHLHAGVAERGDRAAGAASFGTPSTSSASTRVSAELSVSRPTALLALPRVEVLGHEPGEAAVAEQARVRGVPASVPGLRAAGASGLVPVRSRSPGGERFSCCSASSPRSSMNASTETTQSAEPGPPATGGEALVAVRVGIERDRPDPAELLHLLERRVRLERDTGHTVEEEGMESSSPGPPVRAPAGRPAAGPPT